MTLISNFGRVRGFALAALAGAVLAGCGGGSSDSTAAGGGSVEMASGYFVPEVGAKANLSGAIFTSGVADCSVTNANSYASKDQVYLSGGPVQPGSAGLEPNSTFYVQVTDPSGAVLGTPSGTVTSDGNGKLQCRQLISVVENNGLPGFADSPNGVYKVWVSLSDKFKNSESKTDNFMIRTGTSTPDPAARITINKWYDANTNGQWDAGEELISGWKVDLEGFAFKFTAAVYDSLDSLGFGTFLAREYRPTSAAVWVSTNAYVAGTASPINISTNPDFLNSVPVTISSGSPTATVKFGNVCLGAGNGHTLGFWQNKNGKAAIENAADIYAGLGTLTLRDANGEDVNPTTHEELRAFLLGGSATNMAHMLSVQMATMWLNTRAGGVDRNGLVYAGPGAFTGVNDSGFITVEALINLANASLVSDSVTLSGHAQRAYQETLKDLLDNLNNNNQLYVQPTAAACGALTF
ncbi:hypothetical protein JI739_10555 [Ramlibacter sp. AW1]|uniref:Uncharacterized protein n=1 Tax=Ramlibacter aurantiacus TaxID=2801330 RepID=A0A937D3J6_9BURK|nr:hypothetical protein [Ramlibacter aurantiacus]MBL0420785.1 hypothetical protein [Ramlibacter aurantiacus]